MTDVVLLKNPVLQYRVNSSVPANIEAAARRIANLLGGKLRDEGKPGDTAYYVPFAAVHSDLATAKNVTCTAALFGSINMPIRRSYTRFLSPRATIPHGTHRALQRQ